MKRILLETSAAATRIHIGQNLLAGIPAPLAGICGGRRAVVVTDSFLAKNHAKKFAANLNKTCETVIVTVARGEAAKKMSVAEKTCSRLLSLGIGRDDTLITFGGGSVGDLAGFVAATYMRAIPYVQIPTTLNAQADSSIGGKTGVNLPGGKNMVGVFYQPRAVFIDPALLRTLPDRAFNAGMAEVIKTAVVGDSRLFGLLERNAKIIRKRKMEILEKMITPCVRFKSQIVSIDEKENGARMLLNFGHTFGHAIETAGGYGKFLHGEAVAMGMAATARIAAVKGLCAASLPERLAALLKTFSLPTRIPAAILPRIAKAVARDKKKRAGRLTIVFPRKIGTAEIVSGFDTNDVRQMLRESGKI